MPDHGFQQALHPAHIVAEILEGLDHALAHLGIGGEMHDTVDAETAEDAVQTDGIADVALHEGGLACHGGGMARLEIVHHHDFLPERCQGMDRVGTDIARTAANKDRHTDLHNKMMMMAARYDVCLRLASPDAKVTAKTGPDMKEARSPWPDSAQGTGRAPAKAGVPLRLQCCQNSGRKFLHGVRGITDRTVHFQPLSHDLRTQVLALGLDGVHRTAKMRVGTVAGGKRRQFDA